MKAQNKEIRIGKKVLKSILGFAIGIALGYGFVKLIKTDNEMTASIESNIHQNNNFESVEKHISNIATLREAKRINDPLKMTFKKYEKEDIIVIKSVKRYNRTLKNQGDQYLKA